MTTCDSCAKPARFLDWSGDCPDCAKSNPLERAAITLYEQYGRVSLLFPWGALSDEDRDRYRRRAAALLTAAVSERELAQHVGTIAAQTVTVHLLGSDGDT